MSSTTMHFGPEWMRPKHGSSRPAPSPPLTISPTPPGTSTYSALVTPATNPPVEKGDDTHPFRYTKEEMLRIYKEGGGKGGLGIEVERWEGIVREVGSDPVGLKEMTDYEKKLFAGPLNSEIRRRQSTDHLSPLIPSTLGERPKLGHTNSSVGSPIRERIGPFMGRRRGDSTDQPPLTLPRKLSTSSLQAPLASPREAALPSPRGRIGHTPGFDGVLSESWSSRRRATDGLSKPGGGLAGRSERGANESHAGSNGIQEETEDQQQEPDKPTKAERNVSSKEADVQTKAEPGAATNGGPSAATLNDLNNKVSNLALQDRPSGAPSSSTTTTARESPAAGPPPVLTDLASVEWSYLDPQGQTQGPFRADLMQRWYEEGYFSPDLLMKRTHLDADWITVGEMVRRAGNIPIFLTPLSTSPTPPGLPRRPDPLLEGPAAERVQHSPYQPVPTRSLRSSTFDSFLQNGTSAPESPTSSFGAGRFPTASPDPNTLDGRVINQHLYNDLGAGPRMPGYPANIEPMGNVIGQRRATYNEPFDSAFTRRPSYPQMNNGRPAPGDGLAFTNVDGGNSMDSLSQFSHEFAAPGADAASTSSGGFGRTAMNTMRGTGPQDFGMGTGPSTFGGGNYGPIGGFSSPSSTSRVVNRDGFGLTPGEDRQDGRQNLGFGTPFANVIGSPLQANNQAYPQAPSLQFQGQQDLHSLNSFSSISNERQIPMNQLQHPFSQAVQPGAQSPWLQQDTAALRRSGPFDPVHPTSNNTVPVPTTAAPHGRAVQPASANDQSPWPPTSQSVGGAGWGNDPSSLTVANLGQHNQQQHERFLPAQANPAEPHSAKPGHELAQVAQLSTPVVEAPAQEPADEAARSAQKQRRKSAAQPTPAQPAQAAPASAAVVKPPSPAPPVEAKAAWAVGDDIQKARPSGAPLNLREIQEAEARKLEARKAAERERERAARAAAAASPPEEFQPFTTSWGLPTSQAGAARTPAGAKESPVLSATAASSPSTPAWTNAAKPPVTKKTVKEIQEEEERRKKLALKEKETMAAAARRAYAETTTKTVTPSANVGGPWATVGANGKVTPAATPARPAAVSAMASPKVVPGPSTPAVPASSTVTRPAAASVARPAVSSNSLKTTSQKVDDFPAAPSHEFLKWMSESLKGLNNSVNYEEISSMLLSFPLDPDSSTMEIISDLIYASSTTMDGRRFAAEFVNRRKADQASRSKGNALASASTKPTSIADVVKAQPKPTQSEWGGFKVVNKKKKGGRS